MRKGTITFRLDPEKKKALDTVAASLDRDRSYVINEAVRSYLDAYRWQVEHIKEGLRQADSGRFASPHDVTRAFAKWRKLRSEIGRPGRAKGTREMVIAGTPFVIPYRIRRGQVEILAVIHGARRWPETC